MCIRDRDEEVPFETDARGKRKRLRTTVGRLIFNYEIPMDRAVSYTHLDVYKRQLDAVALYYTVAMMSSVFS